MPLKTFEGRRRSRTDVPTRPMNGLAGTTAYSGCDELHTFSRPASHLDVSDVLTDLQRSQLIFSIHSPCNAQAIDLTMADTFYVAEGKTYLMDALKRHASAVACRMRRAQQQQV